jgi:meso-butanediol dehydrogenase/(S,S)-butanediol dehydrogenase/diacetyl reductase
MQALLEDTVSVILGGSNSIGAAIARDFASKGAKVAIFDHDQLSVWHLVEEITLQGGIASAFIVNITNKVEIVEAAHFVLQKYGKIDSWINSSTIHKSHPLLKNKECTWDNIVDINLRVTFFGCQVAVSHMISAGKGSIINISAHSSKESLRCDSIFYASKFGIQRITESVAQEFFNTGIRINTILPATVESQINKTSASGSGVIKRKDSQSEEISAEQQKAHLLTLKKVTDAAVLLASDLTHFMTGHSIKIYGQ